MKQVAGHGCLSPRPTGVRSIQTWALDPIISACDDRISRPPATHPTTDDAVNRVLRDEHERGDYCLHQARERARRPRPRERTGDQAEPDRPPVHDAGL